MQLQQREHIATVMQVAGDGTSAPKTLAHDEIIRQDHLKELAKLISGARLVFIPGASHFALFQQPAAFNDALLDFLDAK